MDSVLDKIDRIYENMNIHRAIVVCETPQDVEIMIPLLSERHYPCASSYDVTASASTSEYENVRIIVVTFLQLLDEYVTSNLGETTVIFCLDESALGDLCSMAQEHGVDLVVSF